MFWIPRSSLKPLGMPSTFCGSKCGSVKLGLSGNSSTDGVYNLGQINVADGNDACGVCAGCGVAYISLVAGEGLPEGYKVGMAADMVYSPSPAPYKPGPDLPPPPPPPPCPAIKAQKPCVAVPMAKCTWKDGHCTNTPPPP
eukprot:COSAG02_NODE_12520_length_1533_cov_1.978382_1_plen_140_part_10